MSATETPRPAVPALPLSLSLALAVLVALGGLHNLLQGAAWWMISALVSVVVLGSIALVRHYAKRTLVPLGGGALALAAVLTLFFAADTAILGIIPTFSSFSRFAELLGAGAQSIQGQGVPAIAVPGILFILALSAGVMSLVMDAWAFAGRAPALAGIPMLAFVAVPGFIEAEFTDPVFFVLAGAAWLLVIYVSSTRTQPGVAFGLGSVALVAALIVPIVLPPVVPADVPANGVGGYATGLNPIIDLGNDLRRGRPVLAMTYTTTSKERQYMRMATLDKFTEDAWEPRIGTGSRNNSPENINTAAGRSDDVTVVTSETSIQMGNVRGRWLPVPYAPKSVTGLVGTWVWDAETLNLRSLRSTVRGQEYTVTTEAAHPTSNQLRAANPVAGPELAPYLELPETLPAVVTSEALAATANEPTNYDKALALQRYFRGGDFQYSEQAPVAENYDGTSATVIGEFLAKKSGYCVHYASAMAAMARTLGIPARIAVGFTTGSREENSETGDPEFHVTTEELHAWPELHFDGVGWIRFEPTVGRGTVPRYNDAVVDDPATPNIDESDAAAVPTDPQGEAAPTRPDSADGGAAATPDGPNGNAIVLALAAAAVLATLAVPAAARFGKRRARLSATARHGSALDAWDEVRDTALDLGWRMSDAETPREFAERLTTDQASALFTASGPIGGSPIGDPGAVAALERLRTALERETFAKKGAAARGAASITDARTVLSALRRGVGPRARLRAALLPASILAAWFALGARWTRSPVSG